MRLRPLLALAVLVGVPVLLAPAALAQPADGYADPAAVVGPRRLSGPRIGVTVLSPGAVERINETFGAYDYETGGREEVIDPAFPVITQFGWQFERRLFQTETGLTGVTELIPLVGGLERGLLLPSISFLVGVRGPSGLEVGFGPNVSAAGAAYAFAAGLSRDLGGVTVPVNLGVVLGEGGPRVSLLAGFTVSTDRY